MKIQQIKSSCQADIQFATEILRPRILSDDAITRSSITSLSQPQQDGIADFFSNLGGWGIVTWVSSILGYIWKLLFDANEKAVDKTEKSRGGGGGRSSGASSSSVSILSIYKNLDAKQKEIYRTMLWVAGGRQHARGWAAMLVSKKAGFTEDEKRILRIANEMYRVVPKLRDYGKGLENLTDKMLGALEEGRVIKYEHALNKLHVAFKIPVPVEETIVHSLELFVPNDDMILSQKELELEKERRLALTMKGRAYAMQLLAKNNYLFVGDTNARSELQRMFNEVSGYNDVDEVRDASTRDHELSSTPTRVRVSADEFVSKYESLSPPAKNAIANMVGYWIGRPEDGDKYIRGELVIDTKNIQRDCDLLNRALHMLVLHDSGIERSEFAYAMQQYVSPRRENLDGRTPLHSQSSPLKEDSPQRDRDPRLISILMSEAKKPHDTWLSMAVRVIKRGWIDRIDD
jgi:hypothetical protein